MNSIYNRGFEICVHFLQWLGNVTGLTYVEISVIFNLWLQGALLMISGCLPFMKMCWLQAKGTTTVNASQLWISGVYALVYIVSFIGMCWHYRLPFQRSFDVCVDDLLRMARLLGTTYNTINIIIFVILFLALIAANIVWTIKI